MTDPFPSTSRHHRQAVGAAIERRRGKRPPPPVAVQEPGNIEIPHRLGCPEADGRRAGDPGDPNNYRKTLGVEAYVATGVGRYDRATGEYEQAPRQGVVRCLECAAQTLVPPEDVPAIQRFLASFAEDTPDAA